MYVRGSNQGIEYKRDDQTFYKGIVVKNNDPLKMHRVKIYIPELSNQPLTDWLQEYKRMNMRFPGTNNTNDAWKDTAIFDEISKFIPWAEPCVSLLGEHGPARYQSPNRRAVITDGNYEETFQTNDTAKPTLETGALSPGFVYANYETTLSDAFSDPSANLTTSCNPYSFLTRPANTSGKAKGVFSMPAVGSKLWVFHYKGDLNFPVYFGGIVSYRETMLIDGMDNKAQQSLDYPGIFENK